MYGRFSQQMFVVSPTRLLLASGRFFCVVLFLFSPYFGVVKVRSPCFRGEMWIERERVQWGMRGRSLPILV
jgi:hypothetical protein